MSSEIEKLRDAKHDHANRITKLESRTGFLEQYMERTTSVTDKLETQANEHEVQLARGKSTMTQLQVITERMSETTETLGDTVDSMHHYIKLAGVFFVLIAAPVIVVLASSVIIDHFKTNKEQDHETISKHPISHSTNRDPSLRFDELYAGSSRATANRTTGRSNR